VVLVSEGRRLDPSMAQGVLAGDMRQTRPLMSLLPKVLGALGAGTIVVVVGFLAFIYSVRGEPAPEGWELPACRSRLRRLGMSCEWYADNKEGRFPNRWSDIPKPQLPSISRLWRCPWTSNYGRGGQGDITPEESDYCLVPGLHANGPVSIMAYDKKNNHPDGSRCILFTDGHVEVWKASREQEFVVRLQREKTDRDRRRASAPSPKPQQKPEGGFRR